MTTQQHANHLLSIWRHRAPLLPVLRLINSPPLVPEHDADEYERDIDVLRALFARS